jgi:hypothetical protein
MDACINATAIGQIDGDKAGPALTYAGKGSKFVIVKAVEAISGFGQIKGHPMQVRVKLDSPGGADFNLYVYEAAPGDCMTATQTSETTIGQDSVDMKWGEGALSNGSSDDRDLYIEVREAAQPCNAPGDWTLTVEHF